MGERVGCWDNPVTAAGHLDMAAGTVGALRMEGGLRCSECTGGGGCGGCGLPSPASGPGLMASPAASSQPGPALGRHVPWALRSLLRLWLCSRHLEQYLEQ